MYRTPSDTALVLAVMLQRSAQNRARVSAKTLKTIGGRSTLRSAFVVDLSDALLEHGWTLAELEAGGYGAIRTATLEAAKAVTTQRYLNDAERKSLRKGAFDANEWAMELDSGEDGPVDDVE